MTQNKETNFMRDLEISGCLAHEVQSLKSNKCENALLCVYYSQLFYKTALRRRPLYGEVYMERIYLSSSFSFRIAAPEHLLNGIKFPLIIFSME